MARTLEDTKKTLNEINVHLLQVKVDLETPLRRADRDISRGLWQAIHDFHTRLVEPERMRIKAPTGYLEIIFTDLKDLEDWGRPVDEAEAYEKQQERDHVAMKLRRLADHVQAGGELPCVEEAVENFDPN